MSVPLTVMVASKSTDTRPENCAAAVCEPVPGCSGLVVRLMLHFAFLTKVATAEPTLSPMWSVLDQNGILALSSQLGVKAELT